jgi:L-asparaginase
LLSEARVALRFRVEELMRKDSLELTAADRALIAERARAAPETRIVVTHGTDTMTQTAKALAAKVPEKTIVLTGALTPRAVLPTPTPRSTSAWPSPRRRRARPGVWIAMSGSGIRGAQGSGRIGRPGGLWRSTP